MRVGARCLGRSGCQFTVWAPDASDVRLHVVSPGDYRIPMSRDSWGYWRVHADSLPPRTRYSYTLDHSRDRPDPASQYQPLGVYGPSEVVFHSEFPWTDDGWTNIPLEEMVIYEAHVGTFTHEGTFEAMITRLETLADLGINTIELMPIGQFPGTRNWGYDGAYPYAVQNSYGGPEGLKRLVDACHARGIAVVLDAVYNHFGPEGCFVKDFGPYLTDKYHSFWGSVINFDDARSDEVRNYFIENALFWAKEYHVDGLRLDAVHTMFDCSARHILQELTQAYERLSSQYGRKYYMISEGSIDDAKYVQPCDVGGHGFDTAWSDGFHHAVFSLLMNGKTRYDTDFGLVRHLVKAFNEGYIFSWQYCPSLKRRIGSSSRDVPAHRLVVFTHNHDTTGNRLCGERFSNLIPFEALKLSAGILMIYPGIPLIFMGEEYGERAPFLYFVSHSDPQLIKSVIRGRIQFFGHTDGDRWEFDPPNPQSPTTFRASRLSWDRAWSGNGRTLWMLNKRLIDMRRTIPALTRMDRQCVGATGIEDEKVLFVDRWCDGSRAFGCFNFNTGAVAVEAPFPDVPLCKAIDSADAAWDGPGASMPPSAQGDQHVMIPPHSFSLYTGGGER